MVHYPGSQCDATPTLQTALVYHVIGEESIFALSKVIGQVRLRLTCEVLANIANHRSVPCEGEKNVAKCIFLLVLVQLGMLP